MAGKFKTLPLLQRSDEWREWRTKVIGASEAAAILNENPWKSREEVMLEKLGIKEGFAGNDATRRGERLEPIARRLYESITGENMKDVVAVNFERPWQAASLDGINDAHTRIVEIKCGVGSHRHIIKTGKPPNYYYAQLQHILSVTGLEAIDYFSYSPEVGHHRLITIRRDELYISRLIQAELSFWNELQTRRPKPAKNVTTTFTTVKHQDGAIYIGEILNGKRHGTGKYTWPNGDIYEGQWADGERTGWGKLQLNSGLIYCGNFLVNQIHGFGCKTHPDGTSYTGEWINGILHGAAKIFWSQSKESYEGQWENDFKDGYGKYIDASGEIYIGCFSKNEPSGFGVKKYKNNERYQGEWEWGHRHGFGKHEFASGKTYEGQWFTGEAEPGDVVYEEFNGFGKLTHSSSEYHIGEFCFGIEHGFGMYVSEDEEWVGEFFEEQWRGPGRHQNQDGEIYSGTYNEDTLSREGEGRCVYPDGSIYQGNWLNGERSGWAIHAWPNGDKYHGEWIQNKRSGRGLFIQANGNRYLGDWLEDKRNGKGKLIYSDQSVYEGEWLAGKQHGTGTLKKENGQFYQGLWENGKSHGAGKGRSASGDYYEGNWSEGFPDGHGRMNFSNGDMYLGNWVKGNMTGMGELIHSRGTIDTGEFIDGRLSGKASRKFPDGSIYEGDWRNGLQDGIGKITHPTGEVVHGIWINGKRHIPNFATKNFFLP